ncbi:flavin reductase family protein [Tumebacillus lipolyticus]|uniref:Flavin reductase family protein n=1 Tax=Tumebacillus lipolyticus TaxID=1280370 RepID=A0ABW4ZT31_9BACL
MNKHAIEIQKLYYGFPVILVSFYNRAGIPNLATLSSSFSLGNMICLGFGRGGHAIGAIREVGQFVVNVPDRNLMEAIEICGYSSGAEHDKFALSGLTPVDAVQVKAPLVAECPISLECEVSHLDEEGGYVIVVGSIVQRHIATTLLDDQLHLKNEAVDPVYFVGDHHDRAYRYLAQQQADQKGTFLPARNDVVWR